MAPPVCAESAGIRIYSVAHLSGCSHFRCAIAGPVYCWQHLSAYVDLETVVSDHDLSEVSGSGLSDVSSRQEFGRALTALRSQTGMTVRQVAEKANAPGAHSTIGDWFSGRGLPSPTSRALLVRVLQACGVTDPVVVRSWLDAWQRVRQLPGPRRAGQEPFRGLASFGADDADWFFGREPITAQLVEAVEALSASGGGLQLVVGPSGAGKSSLLGAGLIPAVSKGAIPGSAHWHVTLFTPGADPIGELAGQLADLTDGSADEITGALRVDPGLTGGYLRQLTGPPMTARISSASTSLETRPENATQRRVVLVVDQFEELFTECKEPAQRHDFIEAIFAAADPLKGGALVVVALRADFYSHALRFPQLAAIAATQQLPVGPMKDAELRQAVEKPARKARIDLEPGLADLLLHDVAPRNVVNNDDGAYEAGVLPLFSHALYATWQQGKGKSLTIAHYRQIGGVGGAIAATAEAVYNRLTPDQQDLARRVLLTLVHVSDDTADTRRRVRYTDLADIGIHPEILDEVLEYFIAQRLLTTDVDSVQISHDAFLAAWPRLRQWLDTDRAGLVVARQLIGDAAAWRDVNKDSGALYRGTRLAVAREWAADHGQQLPSSIVDFLAASFHEERRRARRVTQVISALTVLAISAASLAVYAFVQRAAASSQRQEAISQRNQAVSRLIALRANKLRSTDAALAMQLSLAAYRVAPTVEARSSLLDSSAMPTTTRIRAFTAAAQAVAFSPDKRILAAGSVDQTVRMWDVTDAQHPMPLGKPLTGPDLAVFSIAFSTDGHTLAAGSADGKVHRWDISTPSQPRTLNPLTGLTSTVYSIAFSPNGNTLAAGGADKSIHYWDLSDQTQPRHIATLAGPTDSVQALAFSPDGHILAAGSADATTRLWSIADAKGPAPLGGPLTGPKLKVLSLAFSPDGRKLAAGSADAATYLWDVTNPARPAPLRLSLPGPTSWINALAFSPDGTLLAAGSSDNAVTVWDTGSGRNMGRLPHPSSVTGIAFGHDSHTLASSALDGAIRLWALPGPATSGATNSIFSIAMSSDGQTMAEASRDQTLRIWDITNRRQPTQLGSPITSQDPQHPFAATTAFSPDGHTLAMGTRTGPVELWDLRDRSRPRPIGTPLLGLTAIVQSAVFSPDGQLLAAGGDDATVRIWNVSDPRHPTLQTVLSDTGSLVLFLAFSPNSHILAVAGAGNRIHLWDLTDPTQPKLLAPPLSGATNDINSVAFSPDGRTLAAGSTDRSIYLWNLSDPHNPSLEGRPITGPGSKVFWVSFSPDGKRLAAAVTDGTVWLWDTTNIGRPSHYATIEAFSHSAFTLAFTPDSKVLAASGADATTRLWDPSPERVAEWICDTTGDTITKDEWDQHVAGTAFQSPC